jgi:hypothetical protein
VAVQIEAAGQAEGQQDGDAADHSTRAALLVADLLAGCLLSATVAAALGWTSCCSVIPSSSVPGRPPEPGWMHPGQS